MTDHRGLIKAWNLSILTAAIQYVLACRISCGYSLYLSFPESKLCLLGKVTQQWWEHKTPVVNEKIKSKKALKKKKKKSTKTVILMAGSNYDLFFSLDQKSVNFFKLSSLAVVDPHPGSWTWRGFVADFQEYRLCCFGFAQCSCQFRYCKCKYVFKPTFLCYVILIKMWDCRLFFFFETVSLAVTRRSAMAHCNLWVQGLPASLKRGLQVTPS